MGCCVSTKSKLSKTTQFKRNDGGTGSAEANDINDIVVEVRPGDIPMRGTPLKLFIDDSSIPS